MALPALAALGVQVGGSLLSGIMGGNAAEAQRQHGLEEARRQKARTDEILGEATAATGASGTVAGEGSMAVHLDTMANEFRRQNEWNVKQANAGGDLASDAAWIGALGGVTRGIATYGAANNWFQQEKTA